MKCQQHYLYILPGREGTARLHSKAPNPPIKPSKLMLFIKRIELRLVIGSYCLRISVTLTHFTLVGESDIWYSGETLGSCSLTVD